MPNPDAWVFNAECGARSTVLTLYVKAGAWRVVFSLYRGNGEA